MNGLINTKADYQVIVKNNLGGVRVIAIVDKPSLTTWFASNGKQDHIASTKLPIINGAFTEADMMRVKELRTSEKLQLHTYYELTDVLAMS